MRKTHIALASIVILLSSSVFADRMMDSKACKSVVEACKKAGYVKEEKGDKRFWQDCMKPIVMGQTVKGVDVSMDTVKQCRKDKIVELKKKLQEFESVPNS
ncbi:MAG TPA: hypothetical protein VLI69_06020 [Gammaproteobacteria bacterium]|nr:hypothetical protein [Gammaproteobacteria bacterium]